MEPGSIKQKYSTLSSVVSSVMLHVLLFGTIFFLPKINLHPIKNTEQNKVYVQIIAKPQSTPKTKVTQPQKIKEKSKKETPKKLTEKSGINQKSPASVEQKTENSVKNNISQSTIPLQSDNANLDMFPVAEAVVDKAARCQIPEIPITEDAANAGITSGKVILEVQISPEGKVVKAKILKGTGFKIDDEVLKLAEAMICTSAQKDGKNVAVIKRLQWLIVR